MDGSERGTERAAERAGHRPTDVPAARAALRVLAWLSAQRGPSSAGTIARELGLPRSTTHKLLRELELQGFALHLPEAARWGVGVAAFELASGFSRQEPLARLGRPLLAALVDGIGESAHLTVLHGRDVLYLVEERAARRPALVSGVGVRLPAHLTASGRAMLATLPPAQLRALYPDDASFTHRGEVGPRRYAELRAVLAAVRDDGFAAEDGDVTDGFASVAVAVRDHTGWPAAGLAVTFAVGSDADRDRAALAAEVRRYADELARRIRGSAG